MKKNLTFKFASLIFNARMDSGMTQYEVAEAIGVSVRWLQKLEAGERLPGSIVLLRLLVLFKINPNELEKEVDLIVPVSSNTRALLKTRR